MKIIFILICFALGLASDGIASELEALKKKFETPGSNKYLYSRLIAEEGEAGVSWLLGKAPGSLDGDLEQAIGVGLCYAKIDVYPHLKKMLESKNPETRGFAVLVAWQLVDDRFTPLFKSLLDDKAKPTKDLPELTIADYAKEALYMFEWKKLHPGCYDTYRNSSLKRASISKNP